MAAPDPGQIAAWLTTAAEILDGASKQFIVGHRADSAVAKKGNDFATEIDLAIERQVVAELTRLTGIGVHGEEFGGEPIDSELVWVLDPIDGTFNYAAGSPMAAILLGLLWEGTPLLGLTWLPFMGQRYTSLPGGPLRCNAEALEPLTVSTTLSDSIVGIGTFNIDSRGAFPGRYRAAVLENLSRQCSRMRMHGATGIDLAYVAAGILGGAISFGHHIWDHAAGVALVRAAGGVVTDLAGGPWTPSSRSALAGAPGVHKQMLEIVKSVGTPEEYL
jgi:myo-inositol-1(or 4)-monophosphatase